MACEVVKDKDGKRSIVGGSLMEYAILEYGMLLGGDFDDQRWDCNLLEVEPFNSQRKKMSALVGLPDGKLCAFCKGASEIILSMCDKTVDNIGEPVELSEDKRTNVMDVINGFACEALSTLCLAYKDVDSGSHKSGIPDSGYTLIAVVGIKDPIRSGVTAGITVRMVTGDNINTAKATAKKCDILTADGIAIEGPAFRIKNRDEIRLLVPTDKHVQVKNLRGMYKLGGCCNR